MLYNTNDPERYAELKKREIHKELEAHKNAILRELSALDKYNLTKLREILAAHDTMLADYDALYKAQSAKIDAFMTQYPAEIGSTVRVSSLVDRDAASIQLIIDDPGTQVLYIDAPVSWDAPIYIPSDFTVVCSGEGVINFTGTGCFIVRGTLGAEIPVTGTYVAGNSEIECDASVLGTSHPGDYYLAQGSVNLLDRDSAGDNWLGEGTASDNMKYCYAGDIFRQAQAAVLGGFCIDRHMTADFGTITLHRLTPACNVRFENLNIIHNGDLNRDGIIYFDMAVNCAVVNSRILVNSGTAIGTRKSKNIAIVGNIIGKTGYESSYTNIYDNNLVRITGSNGCYIGGNIISGGSQCVDITYKGGECASHNVTVEHNHIGGHVTGVTTHPGTYDCIIVDNTIIPHGDGVAVRGLRHKVKGNTIISRNPSASNEYGIGIIEGSGKYSEVTGNHIKGFGHALYIHESFDSDRNCSFPASLNVVFSENTVINCDTLVTVRGDENSTNTITKLNADIINNRVMGDGYKSRNMLILSIPACGSKRFSCVNICNNSFATFTTLSEYDIETTVNYINSHENRYQVTTLARGNTGGGSLSGIERDNLVIGSGAVTGTAALRSMYGGIALPALGVEGQTYLLSGVEYIYHDGEWKTR